MTEGYWVCTECEFRKDVHISSTILECPKCHEKYSLVKKIKPHVKHVISITKSSKGKLNVIRPYLLAITKKRPKDVKEYKKILDILFKEPRKEYII